MRAVAIEMRARVERNEDPLTGRPLVVQGPVRWNPAGDGLIDDTGRTVVLTDAGDYAYAETAATLLKRFRRDIGKEVG